MRIGRVLATAAAPCAWFAACTSAQNAVGNTFFGEQQQQTGADGAARAGPPPPPGGEKSTTKLEMNNDARRTVVGSSCGPSALYNRTIDPSRYEFGCPEIEVMMTGPRHYIAGGNSREVYLVDFEGVELVLKATKHHTTKTLTRHLMEAIALDVVFGAPNIAPSLGFCGTSSVQPYFAGGTVEEHIAKGAWTGAPIALPTVLQMSLDAMRGLVVLHEAPGGPIIHNAMRPEQLLVYGNGTVVVSDLNSCNFMGVDKKSGEPCPTRSDIKHNRRWVAPELYGEEGYTEKIDIFSMGIIFWQLMALRTMPFEGHQSKDIPDLVQNDQRPHVDASWDPDYAQLLQDMWTTDPKARPTARQVVARLEEMLQ